LGCLAGLTRMTPYSLNSLKSPSTSTLKSSLLAKLSQVPRSVSVQACLPAAV
jgi:hypothetical protein